MIYHGSRDEPGQQPKVQQVIREGEKVGRNDPCPCGSGKNTRNVTVKVNYDKIKLPDFLW